MTNNRAFGLVMLILGGLLLWFVAAGTLNTAPLLVVFGWLGALGAVLLGLWALLGKY